MKQTILLIMIALMMSGCAGTTHLSVTAEELVATIPDNLLRECHEFTEATSKTGFMSTLLINKANHQICHKDHNALVGLINKVKNQTAQE